MTVLCRGSRSQKEACEVVTFETVVESMWKQIGSKRIASKSQAATSVHRFSNPFCYQLVRCLVRGCANWAVRRLMELDDSAQKPCSLSIPAVLLLRDLDLTAELLIAE